MNPSKQFEHICRMHTSAIHLKFIFLAVVLIAFLCNTEILKAQQQQINGLSYQQDQVLFNQPERTLNPGGALMRSFVLPGWGHYYVDNQSWRRGQFHLGADVLLISTWIYLHTNSNMLQGNLNTFANAYAGINLRGANRRVEIAVGNYLSLAEHNEAQLRARNWDRFIDDIPENRWNWDSEDKRLEYVLMRDRRERAKQQIPAVVSLMVLNRVVSGVHAFIQARNYNATLPDISFNIPIETGGNGFVTTIRFQL